MPGVIYRALSKTTYDFAAVAVSSTETLTIAKAVDVSAYREATLLVRIHSPANFNNTPSVNVQAFCEAPTQEDPAADFIVAANCGQTGAIGLSGLTLPSFSAINLGIIGGFLRIKLAGIQGSPASTIFTVTLSVDIVAKS